MVILSGPFPWLDDPSSMSPMKDASARTCWIFTLSCAALLGCGGDGSAARPPADGGAHADAVVACEPFAACGGDLTGTWRLVNTCPTAAAKMAVEDQLKFCPAGSASLDRYDFSGTATFDTQGAVKYDVLIDIAVSTSLPSSCLGAGQTCTAVQQTLMGQSGVTSAICQTTNAGCSCTYAAKAPDKKEDGYVASGTVITETNPIDGSVETSQYCVDGSTLRVKSDKDGEIDVWVR
jgi:hypothetical protein